MCQDHLELENVLQSSVSESVTVGTWNSLPQHLIEAQSTNSFKNRLDKFWSDVGA